MDSGLLFFPSGPRDATFFSLVVATHAISGNPFKHATRTQLFGSPTACVDGHFSANIYLAEKRGLIRDADRLLQRSGLAGLYAAAMTEERAAAWKREMRARRFYGPHVQRFVTGLSNQKLGKQSMHCCEKCMEEDIANFGFAHWRTVHQVPGVLHCPVHLEPLRGACEACHKSQGSDRHWNHPRHKCPHCGSRAFSQCHVEISDAYRQHLALVASTINGQSSILNPSGRMALYKRAFGGREEISAEEILQLLLDRWKCRNATQLSDAVGAKITIEFVNTATVGDDAGVNPLGHLALIGLADKQLAADTAKRSGFRAKYNMLGDTLQGLRCALSEAGLPERMADSLARGDSLTKIARAWKVPPPRLRRELSQVFEADITFLCGKPAHGDAGEVAKKNLQRMSIKLKQPVRSITVFEKCDHALTLEELRERNRAKVLHYLATGIQTRKQLHYKNSNVGDWCREHDAIWFDEALPSIPQSERKGVGRRKGSRNKGKGVFAVP